ncbi:MAG TPA: amino acid adenylation domain-containing protein, partial [Thermoanaerobaculia bacterium]
GRVALRLPEDLFARLTTCARHEGATPFMLLLTAFQILLHRWSGAVDLCIGSPVAGRNRLETEGVIGFFINTLVLRVHLGGRSSAREALARTREVAIEAYAHQDLPFEKLVEELNPERDLSYAPLFQSLFMLQNTPQGEVRLPELTLTPATRDGQVANFDLTVVLMAEDGGLEGAVTYPTDLFDRTTMLRLLERYERLLADLAASPDKEVADLELLSPAERHQAVLEWSDTGPGERPAPSLHRLFEIQAGRTPEAVALVFEDERITYGQLERWSRRLAHRLHAAGAGPGARIAICTEQDPDMVVMMLAALRGGVSYVALDPELPEARQIQMLEDSAPVLFLVQEALRGRLPGWSLPVLGFDRAAESRSEDDGGGALPEIGPEDISYVVYTSGSTGRPKGILTSHGSGVNHLAWVVRHYGIHASDTILQRGRLLSDASIRDVLSPLWVGARLVMVRGAEARDPEIVAQKIAGHGVTCILAMVPTLLRRVAHAAAAIRGGLPTLRLVVVSGEVLLGTDVAAMREACGPQLRIFNQYGPTEGTMTCLYQGTSPDERRPGGVEVGRPMSGIRVRLLDRVFHPVPIGAPGEVCLGGSGLTHGYPNLADRTAEAFIPDPFAPRGGERLYRTGDLARHLPDGTLQFLGRIDHQIKLRGIRIEPGEVESALRQHPAVRDAVVVMRQEAGDNQVLCAYLVASGEIPAAGLRAFLSGLLPDSIIPSRFVTLPEIPRTATGKVDRRALPEPPDGAAAAAPEPPRTAAQELLAGLWQDLLRRERIGLDEDFFEAGGHSLLAT